MPLKFLEELLFKEDSLQRPCLAFSKDLTLFSHSSKAISYFDNLYWPKSWEWEIVLFSNPENSASFMFPPNSAYKLTSSSFAHLFLIKLIRHSKSQLTLSSFCLEIFSSKLQVQWVHFLSWWQFYQLFCYCITWVAISPPSLTFSSLFSSLPCHLASKSMPHILGFCYSITQLLVPISVLLN